MKIWALALTLFASCTPVFAGDLNLRCKGGADCADRIAHTLTQMNCDPVLQTLLCRPSQETGYETCFVTTDKCNEPRAGMFLNTDCFAGSKVGLKRFDKGLTLTWWMGLWGSYIREICVSN